MTKRSYTALTTEILRVESSAGFLTGSLTAVPIEIGTVKVENFEAGFNEGGNDFKDISFD